MKANAVLQQFFKKHGVKSLAQTLGLSEPFLYKWCQPDDGKAERGWNPVARIAALTAATGDPALVEYICRQAGGTFVRREQLPALAHQSWRQFKAEMEALLKMSKPKARLAAGEGRMKSGCCKHRLPGGRCGWLVARRN